MKLCDVIVDLQSGDTGKGKVTHSLLKSGSYNLVLRYNGGSNAGHTIYHEGKKIVTHQVPAGVLYGIPSLIGLGCVVNIEKLIEEIHMLNQHGIDTNGLIMIDKRAHVVTDDHLNEDGNDTSIGTTRQGIGPAYRSKYGRTGKRISDLHQLDGSYFSVVDSLDVFDNSWILAEGAQGFALDIDWGDYPYVTSSHCTVGSVCLNGVPPRSINRVYGIAKAYETYVGAKDFGMTHPAHDEIQHLGQEFGATTGRPRKVNWLNVDSFKKAIKVNGVSDIIINKLDILDKVGVYGIIKDDTVMILNKEDYFHEVYTAAGPSINVVFSTTPYGI